MIKNFIYSLVIFCGFMLVSCTKQDKLHDLHVYVQQIAARPAVAITVPEMISISAISPSITVHRNPFVLAEEVTNPVLPSSILAQFSIDSLTMVGTLANTQTTWALIQSPQNLIRITVGQYLGQTAARVLHIYADHIELVDNRADAQGNFHLHHFELRMRKTANA